jgi:thiamine biosynthesis lipoprotein
MLHALIIFLSLFQSDLLRKDSLHTFQVNGTAQGTTYHCTYYSDSNNITKKQVDDLLASIDSSLSLYKNYSRISQFNQHPRGILMDAHMKTVVEKAIEISAITNGTFDITCKPIIELWKTAAANRQQPKPSNIRKLMKTIGFQHVSIKGDSLIKDNPAVQIDCDGIAQGYSVDQVARLLKESKINDFIVELGGEIFASGHPPGKTCWEVAIHTSSDQMFETADPVIRLSNAAVTTSGSMNKYIQSGKKIFSHIVHPRKGKPIRHKIISVTVIAKDAITADALDNALMVMGVEKAMKWLINHPIAAAQIDYRKGKKKSMQNSNLAFKKLL